MRASGAQQLQGANTKFRQQAAAAMAGLLRASRRALDVMRREGLDRSLAFDDLVDAIAAAETLGRGRESADRNTGGGRG